MKSTLTLFLLFLIPIIGSSQGLIKVYGVVSDSNGVPLPGVNIEVKGTARGASTDFDGHYEIEIESGKTLKYSIIGFKEYAQKIAGDDREQRVDIEMEEGASELDEVVIVGYGEQKKINLTGSVSEVKSDAFQDRPISSLAEGIQGKVPGLMVSPGNAPGAGSSFNIRGITSINGGSPLILVDGVEQDPEEIDPNNIESVSVLKDGASTAIYGSRAAYGVILITTKSGRRNTAPTIQINSSYAIRDRTVHPKYVNSMEYMDYMDMASHNSGQGDFIEDRIRKGAEAYFEDPNNNPSVLYDPDIDKEGYYKYVGNTDWEKVLYKKGNLLKNNVSISGGSKSTSYYLSYGKSMEKGFYRAFHDGFKRDNVKLNVNSDVNDWLTVYGNVDYTRRSEDHPSFGVIKNPRSGLLGSDLNPLMPDTLPGGHYSGQGLITNINALASQGGYMHNTLNGIKLNGAVEITPFKNFTVKMDYTFKPLLSEEETTKRKYEEYHGDGSTNIYPWTDPNGIEIRNFRNDYQVLNLTGVYKNSFKGHNFNVLVGYNQEENHSKLTVAGRDNLIVNDLPAINRATGEKSVDGFDTSWGVLGYFYRLNYNFEERYLFEINGRYDGSSRFSPGRRYVFSPSASIGWVLSREKFWNSNIDFFRFVNQFKLRGSVAQQANQIVGGDFPYIPSYGVNTSFPYVLGTGSDLPTSVSLGAINNPNFTWEKVKQWDIGLDIGFLNDKVTLSFDYYNRYTIGMLTGGKPLPAVLGVGVPRENAADLRTEGWDLSLNWNSRMSEDIEQRVSLNLSNSKAHITKFDNPTGDLGNYYPGYEIGQIWGFETDGLFQSQDEIESWVDQSKLYGGTWNPGDVKYVDQDGDGEITNGDYSVDNHGDLIKIGNSEPQYVFGLNYGLNWKGLSLDLFFQGVGRQNSVPDWRYYGISGGGSVPMRSALNYWSKDNPDGFLPRPYIDGAHGNQGALGGTPKRYLLDKAYLRLKQITLSYAFSGSWLSDIGISEFSIFFTGQNLWTWTSLPDIYDPENLNLEGYPVNKSYAIGINLKL